VRCGLFLFFRHNFLEQKFARHIVNTWMGRIQITEQEYDMNFSNLLHWAVIFLVVAIVAGLLGFGGIAGTAMEGAKLVFWVAIVIAIISFVVSLMRKA
jgi:uncharacterized membrane protein YtjA (UPF0391 family)